MLKLPRQFLALTSVCLARALFVGSLFAPALAAAAAWDREPQCIVVSSGVSTIERRSKQPQANWQLEFPARPLRLPAQRTLEVMPIAGVMASAEGSLYAYGGGRIERPLGRRWVFSPSFAIGLYQADKGKRLGGALEFRSGLELSLRVFERVQVGMVVFHLSNGHVYPNNPGTESVLFTYRASLR